MIIEKVYDELNIRIDNVERLAQAGGNAEIWKQLETSKTATGASVSITDAAPVYASNVEANILYNQAGTGIPSPDNVRPITGHSSEVITLNDNTTTISFGETLYQGTFDISTGTITVTHKSVNLGTLTWAYQEGFPRFRASLSDIKSAESRTFKIACDCYQSIYDKRPHEEVPDLSIYNVSGHYFAIQDESYTDADLFKAAVADHYIVYPLETPLTIQLTPMQIKLLKGSNTISASTGNITITYQPDNVLGNILGQAQEFALNSVYIAPALDTGDKIADFAIGNNSGVLYETPTPETRTTAKKKP